MTTTVQTVVRTADEVQRRRKVLAVPFAVAKKFGEDGASNLASLVAYYSFLSLFPLLLVFITVVGYTLADRPDLQHDLLDSALAQFPVIGDQLRANVTGLTGNGWALVIGVLVALWAGMGATTAMQEAMNKVWRVPYRSRPNFLASRLRSFAMSVLLAIFVGGSVALGSVATVASSLGPAGRVGALALALLVNTALFLVAFKVLTSASTGWRAHLPGAVLAGVVWLVLQAVGTVYVQHVVSGASQTYGAFAVVLGLVSYLYLQAQLTLYAAELNTVLAQRLWPRALDAERLTPADTRSLGDIARVEERLETERIDAHLAGSPPGEEAGGATSR